jgi:ribose transport system substrate-binding protein
MTRMKMKLTTAIVGATMFLAAGSAFAQDAAALDPAKFDPPTVVGMGPNGEQPGTEADVALTAEELQKVKDSKFKVAIAMQTMDIDFSKVLVAGMQSAFDEAGVEVIAITDAGWKPEKQIADIENLIQLKPDAILSVPSDGVATAATYAKVSKAGIKLGLFDTIPKGLKYPEDYQAGVGPDAAGLGQIAVELLATRIPEGGTLGMVAFNIDLWAANERERAAMEWLGKNRPDIVVKRAGFQNPAQVGQITSDFLTANPDVQGIWTTFDGPGLEAISAMRGMGVTLPSATADLGGQISFEIAQDSGVIGVGAQRLTNQGRALAHGMMKVLLGGTAPSFVAVPALTVTKENLLEGYKLVWNQDAPEALVAACAATAGCK